MKKKNNTFILFMENTVRAICRVWEDGEVDRYYASLFHNVRPTGRYYEVKAVYEKIIKNFFTKEEMKKMKKLEYSIDNFIYEFVSDTPDFSDCGVPESEIESLLK